MNLKEAFRYQNRLQSDIDEAKLILSGEKNVTKVEKTQLSDFAHEIIFVSKL